MKIIISPAKSLDFEKKLPIDQFTQPSFLNKSEEIIKVLKQLTPNDLSNLMKISPALGELNWQRNQEFKIPFTPKNARPAVYAFNGDVYQGLDAYSISEQKIDQLQSKLRILSGQYGLLKPLDLIQPYRLEMGTKLAIGNKKNLYEYWKETLTDSLNQELENNDILINLASHEYSSVINFKKIKVPVIAPEFKDYKNGQLKIISFFAKKARGLMVRYIIENNIKTLEDLKSFNYERYSFDASLSTHTKLVFTR
ncbi:peroxide stress protein YaaA [Flavobacterium columnare]|uniref:peroxide stress protein YaaA n=1 Tax=Flavobacterium columnare TaxID=996 RepID=UPI0013D0DDD2|nr:peroxide stress protein YaaA [Flavobacterium columnare]